MSHGDSLENVVSWNQKQICKELLQAVGYNIICCVGSDSRASSSETNEVC